VGVAGSYKRTERRRDYSYPLPAPTLLDNLIEHGKEVYLVGKLEDIFNKRGMTESFHTGNNSDTQEIILKLISEKKDCLIFANLVDFDSLWGHRRDALGYAGALERTDIFLAGLIERLAHDDLLIVTADHGNDPTFRGTDHTREFVPLLSFAKNRLGKNLGLRHGFYDVAQSLAAFFGVPAMPLGKSFI
jgi:phosphopentomutase